jgi:hypothetical protein
MTDVPRDDQQHNVEPRTAGAVPARSDDEQPQTPDPNDEVPVPIVMSPAEVDERAQVVEALREEEGVPAPPEQTDQQG